MTYSLGEVGLVYYLKGGHQKRIGGYIVFSYLFLRMTIRGWLARLLRYFLSYITSSLSPLSSRSFRTRLSLVHAGTSPRKGLFSTLLRLPRVME